MNRQQRIDRVGALVGAANRLADPHAAGAEQLRSALVAATGLSRQGVALALREHLETRATERDIAGLVDRAGSATRVHVVLSANVFTAGLRALALAVAATSSVHVRCSSRERVFVPALLAHVDDPGTRDAIREVTEIGVQGGEAVHLYGSDESLVAICQGLPGNSVVRAHGTGMGVALVGRGAAPEDAARRLANDMVVFDQRGCLSPRLALVDGWPHAERVAHELSLQLDRAQSVVPTGELDSAERAEIARFRATGHVVGEWFAAGEGGVVAARALRGPWVAPVGRNQLVVGCEGREDLTTILLPLARHVAAIGISGDGEGFFRSVFDLCPGARVSELGRMQRPRFDGPVDRRHCEYELPGEVVARLGGRGDTPVAPERGPTLGGQS